MSLDDNASPARTGGLAGALREFVEENRDDIKGSLLGLRDVFQEVADELTAGMQEHSAPQVQEDLECTCGATCPREPHEYAPALEACDERDECCAYGWGMKRREKTL